jgi:hypothetical protein
MKEAANSLLKVLEEPPPNCTLILLSENPAEMLPTIRSRAMLFRLGAIPVETSNSCSPPPPRAQRPAPRPGRPNVRKEP